MLFIALALLLTGAAGCLGLSRLVATRRLGQFAAALCAICALLLAYAPADGGTPVALLRPGAAEFSLRTALAPAERALALGGLGAGAALLLSLGSAVAPGIRGFGAIFAWSLLSLLAALLSLATPPLSLLQPLGWALAAQAGYGALRAGGGATAGPPRGATLGLLAAVLLGGALLVANSALATGGQPAGSSALAILLAVLALAGLAPLHSARAEAVAAPAQLGALLYAVVYPLIALGTLLRLGALLPVMPPVWGAVLGVLGALGSLACAAGALGTSRLRELLAWVAGAQSSLVLICVGLGDAYAALAGHTLLIGQMLAAVAGALAAAELDRSLGSDDYSVATPGPRLGGAGLLWAIGGAAALGLPPLLSFWGRSWLYSSLIDQMPWLLPPLLAALPLAALALAAPLARFWGARPSGQPSAAGGRADLLLGAIGLGAALLLGLMPQLIWAPWLAQVPFAPARLPVVPTVHLAAAVAGLIALLLGVVVAALPSARTMPADPDETPVAMPPTGLGAAVRPLAWLADPDNLLRALLRALDVASGGLRLVMQIFEQRYYLLGILMVLISVMLLMAQ